MTVSMSSRSLFGFRLISILPLFGAALVPSDADEGRQGEHSRVLQDAVGDLFLTAGHGVEGNRRRGFRDALNHAGILKREKAFRDDNVQERRDDDGADGDHQGQFLAVEHPVQPFGVFGDDPVEEVAAGPEECVLVFFRNVFQQPRAHHRRQGQRNDGGNQDGDSERDGEFPESRPITSPMKSSGISTAIRDTVREMIVKPICFEPFRAASIGLSPSSM